MPYPIAITDPGAFTRLPEPEDEAALRSAAASAYGVADPAMVVAAPGTQILISLLPHLLRRTGEVAVVEPTYAEHAVAWAQAGHRVRGVTDLGQVGSAGTVVLCNPNNPDGRRHETHELLALADRLAKQGGLLVVDEAFADLEPDGVSLAPVLPHPAILILRSFGKTYGLAGLRLGLALAEPALAGLLRQALGPWAVSGLAIAAALQALPDAGWRDAARSRLQADAARLHAAIGQRPIGATSLFCLYAFGEAALLADHLGQAGILVRSFADQPDRLRFGLPEPISWPRLEAALVTWRARPSGPGHHRP